MGLKRVFSGNNRSLVAFGIEFDEKACEMEKSALSVFDTEDKLQGEVTQQMFPVPVFVHKNRDGTIAIATGEEPDVWPEDEVDLGPSL